MMSLLCKPLLRNGWRGSIADEAARFIQGPSSPRKAEGDQ